MNRGQDSDKPAPGLEKDPVSAEPQAPLINKLLEISARRRKLLLEMRTAIRAGDKEAVFNLAGKLTGLSDEASHRADPSIN